jgi:hypothetical protein
MRAMAQIQSLGPQASSYVIIVESWQLSLEIKI